MEKNKQYLPAEIYLLANFFLLFCFNMQDDHTNLRQVVFLRWKIT